MTWTDPRTWVTDETVTAALMNTHVRDNLKAIGDVWTSYGSGSSWTAVSSNPSLGNGTWSGRYIQAGKLVIFAVKITAGSTTTFGSGRMNVALPVTVLSSAIGQCLSGTLWDNSAGVQYSLLPVITTTTTVDLWQPPTTAGNDLRTVSATNPVTLATNDYLAFSGVLEAA